MPFGWLNAAAVPVPAVVAAVPEPASVVTTPWSISTVVPAAGVVPRGRGSACATRRTRWPGPGLFTTASSAT